MEQYKEAQTAPPSFYFKYGKVIDYGIAFGAPLLAGSLSFLYFRSRGRRANAE